MKCPYCGIEYSDKVIEIHMDSCLMTQMEQEIEKMIEEHEIEKDVDYVINEEDLRQLAKEKKISNYWNKSIETLKEELGV